jgi:hypothetical protein
VPGFDDLSEDARAAIRDFSTLWSLFEGAVLGAQGSAGALIVILDGLRERGVVDLAPLASAIEHSRGRYFANGTFTPAFDQHLHFRNTDHTVTEAFVSRATNDVADTQGAADHHIPPEK